MANRKLPIGGVQTFSKVREEYDVYVDKTMHIYDIASRYTTVFLARPRRFGKSLLCSTIKSLFCAEKELFEGLAIIETDWKWKAHPVIHLDLSTGDYTSNGSDNLVVNLNRQLKQTCESYDIKVEISDNIANNLALVIAELHKHIEKAVLVIDEYDYPLLSTMNQPELNADIREKLKGFFGVIKQTDRFLRFSFVTGVTKFAQISMFSGFNQPKDISMIPKYGDICGITQEELETCFALEIEGVPREHGGRPPYL